MGLKIPPPAHLARDDPELNRYLMTITGYVNPDGKVNGGDVQGLDTLLSGVDANAVTIASLKKNVDQLTTDLATAQTAINRIASTLSDTVNALQIAISNLAGRNQVYTGQGPPANSFGNSGDYYTDVTANVDNVGLAQLYIKVGGTWRLVR